ncbi:nuclear transport factor 2 family protein [Prosthecobacter fluviatilis]|uniref:Nuclear transport factor 2 family protein n=1 Tax=Prosthecobacter fluviatilis TaxID=445931 RepID=A0ABW0KWK6_9BACT
MPEPHAFAEEWIAAWNAHDLPRILSHYSEDLEFESPFISRVLGAGATAVPNRLVGREAVAVYWGQALARYPDLRFELRGVLAGAHSLCVLYQSVQNLPAAECFWFDDQGLVCRAAAHYA